MAVNPSLHPAWDFKGHENRAACFLPGHSWRASEVGDPDTGLPLWFSLDVPVGALWEGDEVQMSWEKINVPIRYGHGGDKLASGSSVIRWNQIILQLILSVWISQCPWRHCVLSGRKTRGAGMPAHQGHGGQHLPTGRGTVPRSTFYKDVSGLGPHEDNEDRCLPGFVLCLAPKVCNTHTHTHLHTHTCTHTHTCAHTNMYTHMHACPQCAPKGCRETSSVAQGGLSSCSHAQGGEGHCQTNSPELLGHHESASGSQRGGLQYSSQGQPGPQPASALGSGAISFL